MNNSIYGKYEEALKYVLEKAQSLLEDYDRAFFENENEHIFEHVSVRLKSDESMREKCRRKGIPENEESALSVLKDAIGLRIVCSFIDDVYKIVEWFKTLPEVHIVTEKDYISHSKPNGYRSYHMIFTMDAPFEDITGSNPGSFFVEVQLRTIAMDSWASLEHKLKYKKSIENQKLIESELKRCADELAACDVSMQTIRELIRKG